MNFHSNIFAIRFRLLQILAALDRAAVSPISNRDLHAFAYLANALSPVWEVEPLENSVLKDEDGPRSSSLEREIDLCVGYGLVDVISIERDDENPDKLNARFSLSAQRARKILSIAEYLPDEQNTFEFLTELAFSFAEISKPHRDDAALVDASWSDPKVAQGRIINFIEEEGGPETGASHRAAEAFQEFVPPGVILSRAEKLVMYMRLLKKLAHG